MSETKRRLLISKWRSELEALRDLGENHHNIVADRDEEIAKLKADLAGANDEVESLETELNARDDDMTRALTDVKYWLHDGIVHGKIVSDPRRMLRKVEEVLQ